ncbi:MAG: hypothetical protein FWD92_04575 [Methanomassiliicoccaceae archaeon]|nr:hypothetical protein [Methanomassiliicoccaceae archaeon]
MLRQIINVDGELCEGCSFCANICSENVIRMTDGKAIIVHKDRCIKCCDCIQVCKTGAVSFVIEDMVPYDATSDPAPLVKHAKKCGRTGAGIGETAGWPIQLKLVPMHAHYPSNTDLLIAADCTAFASPNFHEKFILDRAILIGCAKLDREEYCQRLSQIIDGNDIRSITLVRMDMPCCIDITRMVKEGLAMSSKDVPLSITVLSTKGAVVRCTD